MLRNLLYSFFFHLFFIALFFLSGIEFDREVIKDEATPLTINFLNDNPVENIDKLQAQNQDERVKDLTLDEKIDLYNKVKKQKELQKEIEKTNKVIYEKSQKKPLDKKLQQIRKTENTAPNNGDGNGTEDGESQENEFSYYYTPVYVAENKVNTEEKRKLIENRLKREELRKKIKERNIIPEIDVKSMKQMQSIESIVKVSQKPLVVKKEKKAEKKLEKEVETSYNDSNLLTNEETTTDINSLINEISNNTVIIDEKYAGLNEDNIFSDEDIKKLKQLEDEKIDPKYVLSLREKRNIQRQIKGCYKMAILRSKKDSKAIVALTVRVNKDGIINMNDIKVNKIVDNFDKEGFDIALENAKSALVFCSPLRGLPVGKYKTWKQMTFVFDSNNLE